MNGQDEQLLFDGAYSNTGQSAGHGDMFIGASAAGTGSKARRNAANSSSGRPRATNPSNSSTKEKKTRRGADSSNQKRRCVSTACIACRRRKSKCDGAVPSCAACASVYGTECVYDPNSDHRRKGVYREKVDSMKAQNSTLQILIEAILNAAEDEVAGIVKKIRTCDSLDVVAEQILKQEAEGSREHGDDDDDDEDDDHVTGGDLPEAGERELARKMGELRIENGSVRFIGGTSHLIYMGDSNEVSNGDPLPEQYSPGDDPITSWTRVTADVGLIKHLMTMYFTYHYAYFTTLSKKLFWRDFTAGRASLGPGTAYCSSLLVNAMLALGCHFTNVPGAYGTPGDSRTKGDHFFAEAKRLIVENDEYEKPRLATVQALALMSVREAGCAREAKGWVYSGMSFRMAQDIGLNLELNNLEKERMSDEEVDARRITFWGCFLFDKCWSNYLGRLPQLPSNSFNVSKIDVFPDEDASMWTRFTDDGPDESSKQASRTRAVALQMSKLCEISSDLLIFFYHPNHIGRSSGKAVELKKLSELHQRLEEWRKDLPKELEAAKEKQLPNVILMHMFFHLQYIHLFRPFLKYAPSASPLPAHVSPRRICTANAGAISKLMRLYKKSWDLRQICNIAVYMTHSACTIHLLNLPEKTARRDIIHGIKQLEEIAEDWLCARRTLSILSVLARKWRCVLPDEAAVSLQRADEKYGHYSTSDVPSPRSIVTSSPTTSDGSTNAQSGRAQPTMSHYAQPNMAVDNPPVSSIDNRISSASNGAMMGGHAGFPTTQQQVQQNVGAMPGLMTDGMSGWLPSASTSSGPVNYPNGFVPPSSASLGPNDGGQSDARHVSPTNVPGMDGREWFLDDSARWQQSFASWAQPGSQQQHPQHSHPPKQQQHVQGVSSGDSGTFYMYADQNTAQDSGGGIPQQTPASNGGESLGMFGTLGMSLNGQPWLNELD